MCYNRSIVAWLVRANLSDILSEAKLKEKFQKIVESRIGVKADKLCNSLWYPIAVGAVCIFCHSLNIPVIGALLLTALLVPALLFCKNSYVLAPIMAMSGFVLSAETKPNTGYFNAPLKIVGLCFALAFILTALVFNIIYYGKWKAIFKRAYLTVSIAIVTGVLLASGLGSPWMSWSGVGMSMAIAVAMFLPYVFLLNCGVYQGRKTVEYFAWTMISAAVVIFAAVFKQYALNGFDMSDPKSFLQFGYAISNSAAAIVLLAVPLTFYMIHVYDRGYLFFIALAVELLTILFTFSRASLVVAVPGTAIVSIAMCFKKRNGRLGYYIAFGVSCALALALMIVFREKIFGAIKSFFNGMGSGSGRIQLWKEGFEEWRSYPVFGVGIWYLPQVNIGHHYHSYHCTPITFLYCAGAVGLLGYLYHRYRTVRLVFGARLTTERIFVALTVLSLICNSLLDIYMTEPLHLVYYSILLALAESDVRAVKAADKEKETAVAEEQPSDVSDAPPLEIRQDRTVV